MSAHTPAPWVISRSGATNPKPCGIRSVGVATGMICHLPTAHEDIEANASLIAMAPELLESLRQCVASLEHWFPRWGDPEGANSQMMKNARRVILKAEGGAR